MSALCGGPIGVGRNKRRMLFFWRALPERSTPVLVLLTLLAIVVIQYVLASQLDQKDPQVSRRKVKAAREFRKFSDIVGNRGFHYMKKLVSALDEQLKDFDDKEDSSVRQWAIRGYKPDDFNEDTDSVIFKASRFNLDSDCNVSHIEFLLPLVRSETKARVWTIHINGQKHTHSGGTVGMEHVAIFNLTGTRLPERHVQDFNIVVASSESCECRPLQSVLFFYCNLNTTILQKFRAHHQRSGKSRSPSNSDKVKINFEAIFKSGNFDGISGFELNGAKFEEPCDEHSESCRNTNQETSRLQETNFVINGRKKINSLDHDLRSLQEKVDDLPSSDDDLPSSDDDLPSYTDDDLPFSDNDLPSSGQNVEDITTPPPSRHERPPLADDLNISDDRTRILLRKRRSSCPSIVDDAACACRREKLLVKLSNALPQIRIIGSRRATDLGRCEGSCSHALSFDNIDENISAHAVLLNLHKTPNVAGNVTCAAHKMASVPILTYDSDYGLAKMTILQNLRILSCRCV